MEEIKKICYKYLVGAFERSLKSSPMDANNSEFHLPALGLKVAPEMTKEILGGVASPVHNQVHQPGRVGSKGGTLNAGESIAELKLKLKAADLVMKAIDEMVDRGALDSRSQIADARLNYCVPFQYHYLKG